MQSIEGRAVVVDGDSLRIGKLDIRLAGIDAAELGQTCKSASGVEWDCGLEAKRRLVVHIADKPVSCYPTDIDRFDRIISICTAASGVDLAAAMVRSGYALARGGDRYLADERSARIAGSGMWSGSFRTPWEWRAQKAEEDY